MDVDMNKESQNAKRKTQNRTATRFLIVSLLALLWTVNGRKAFAAGATPDSYLHYLRGIVEERSGHNAKALEAYERAVAQDPQALEVYRDIASLQLRLGRPEEALKAAEAVKKLAPQDPASLIFMGNVQVAAGNLAQAADSYEAALKLDPNNLSALENLGNYYAMLDPQKAVPYYERYLTLSPGAGDILMQLGLVYHKLGKTEQALASFDHAAAIDARQASPYLAKAEIYEQQFSTAAAVAAYQKAKDLDPHNGLIALKLGHLYYESGRWDEAQTEFNVARESAPSDPAIAYWLARVSEERKEWPEAAHYAQQAYEASQDNQFLPLVAYYLTLAHDTAGAVQWLERARQANPQNASTLLFLGINQIELGRYDDARRVLTEAVSLYPKDVQMHFHLGVAQDRLGHAEEAEKQFQTVLSLDPKHAGAMNYLGYSWADKGIRLNEAEKLLREAVRLEPENPAFNDSLGWVLFRLGKINEAKPYLEKSALAAPDSLVLDHLAQANAAMGQWQEALQAWDRALAIEPKNSDLRTKRDQAAERVGQTADPAKLLAAVTANAKTIEAARAAVRVQFRWLGRSIKSRGWLTFARPDALRLDLEKTGKVPAGVFLLENGALTIRPQAWVEALQNISSASLAILPQAFTAEWVQRFTAADTRIDREKNAVHFSRGHEELWVDPLHAVVTRFSRPATTGEGRESLEITDYRFVGNAWLPGEFHLMQSQSGWDTRLRFSDWVLNSPGLREGITK